MEPYRYTNGEAWGDPTKTPDPAQEPGRQAARGRGTHALALRLRRARTDPTWAEKSEATKRLLLEIDKREERP